MKFLQKLLNRIPRPMFQVGLVDNNRTYWGFITPNWADVEEENKLENEYGDSDLLTFRIVLISPAKLENLDEFKGW